MHFSTILALMASLAQALPVLESELTPSGTSAALAATSIGVEIFNAGPRGPVIVDPYSLPPIEGHHAVPVSKRDLPEVKHDEFDFLRVRSYWTQNPYQCGKYDYYNHDDHACYRCPAHGIQLGGDMCGQDRDKVWWKENRGIDVEHTALGEPVRSIFEDHEKRSWGNDKEETSWDCNGDEYWSTAAQKCYKCPAGSGECKFTMGVARR